MNLSKTGRFYCLRFSSFFSSRSLRIRWWLYLKDIELWHFKQALKKWFYCNRRYHQLGKESIAVRTDKKEISIEYIRCFICDWKFFATAEDKRNYLAISGNKRNSVFNAMERLLKNVKNKKVIK